MQSATASCGALALTSGKHGHADMPLHVRIIVLELWLGSPYRLPPTAWQLLIANELLWSLPPHDLRKGMNS
eukprot:3159177-Amphidinium_carterae.1